MTAHRVEDTAGVRAAVESVGRLFAPDDVVEFRALFGRNRVAARYMLAKDIPAMVPDIIAMSEKGYGDWGLPCGVYFTPQSLDPSLSDRCSNSFSKAGSGTLTGDAAVTIRRFLLVDIDPKRPGTVMATAAEKAAAEEIAGRVREFFAGHGWPAPAALDTGNGVHLYYSLPADEPGGKCDGRTDPLARLLAGLAAKFDTPAAHIDTAVYNPSRIMRVPGGWNRKGTESDGRTHRRAGGLIFPDGWSPANHTGTPVPAILAELGPAPDDTPPADAAPKTAASAGDGRPGDDFNRRAAWSDILTPHDWLVCGTTEEKTSWVRPGKDGAAGLSATTEYCRNQDNGNELFYVFSDKAHPFKPKTAYNKFRTYTFLNHSGDFKAATRALAAAGYGTSRQSPKAVFGSAPPAPVPTSAALLDFALDPYRKPTDPHRLAAHFLLANASGDDFYYRFRGADGYRWTGSRWEPVPSAVTKQHLTADIARVFDADHQSVMVAIEKARAAATLLSPDPEGSEPGGQDAGGADVPTAETEAEATAPTGGWAGPGFLPGKPVQTDAPRPGGVEVPDKQAVTTKVLNDAMNAVLSVAAFPRSIDPPDWFDGAAAPPRELFAAGNGLVHLPKYAAGDPTGFIRHTPKFFNLSAADYAVDPDAPPPKEWLAFVNGVWPNDPEAIALLQEWFGYLLLPDNRMQKMLLLLGLPRSGKGTTLNVIRGLLGEASVQTFELHNLGGNGSQFALANFPGKLAAIEEDAKVGEGPGVNWGQVAGRLKTISGSASGVIEVNRKNTQQENLFVPIRFVIAANDIPAIPDQSGALASRYCILRYGESHKGREDLTLLDRLLPELPGIFNWAVEGWKRLRDRGRFTEPASSAGAVSDLNAATSPISRFVAERCDVGRGLMVPKAALLKEWGEWWSKQGFKEAPPAKNRFKEQLESVVGAVGETMPRINGSRIEHYTGIGLRSPSTGGVDDTLAHEQNGVTADPPPPPRHRPWTLPVTGERFAWN